MKINPKSDDAKKAYTEQKSIERVPPVSGVFDVVNIKGGWSKVGSKGTEKLRIFSHVLAVIECKVEDKKDADALVNHAFPQDIWWNLMKEGRLNYNGQRVVNMAIACGCDEEFDTDDRDALIKIFCNGTPYRIKIEVSPRRVEDKVYYDVNVTEAKRLSKEFRQKYRDRPDFSKIMPPVEERRLEDADYSTGGGDGGERSSGGGRRGKRGDDEAPAQGGDPFRADEAGSAADMDDLPF